MERSLQKLVDREFDVLVIGGGIYGACVAWDAALRGFSVALVEKNDFGAATSANSLKIIHGGLRYLQDGNLNMVRSMIKERSIWLRIAPHLVHPLPVIMPTYRQFSRSKLALGTAMVLNDSLGFDRNRNLGPLKQIPNGRILSRSEVKTKMHWIDSEATGGVMWHDAQVYDSERLLISIIKSAVKAGATVANYVKVFGFQMNGRIISRVNAKDILNGRTIEIRSKLVINCCGAWSDQVLGLLENKTPAPTYLLSAAVNLVIRKHPLNFAAGVPSSYLNGENKKQSKMLFITPWQKYTIAGTWHLHCDGRPQDFRVTDEMIENCIEEVNAAYPVLALQREDICRVHVGFLPLDKESVIDQPIKLLRENQIHDHTHRDGVDNLITITGVKYTTARKGAQQVVDLAVHKLNRPPVECRTSEIMVDGGDITQLNDYIAEAIGSRQEGISEQSIAHLVHSYGTNYKDVLNIAAQKKEWAETVSAESPVLKAEIIYAVRKEIAQTLSDVVYRRTPLGMAGKPDNLSLQICASLMAVELGWDQFKMEEEIAAASNEHIRSTNQVVQEVT
jgi:glycerol-3-phosphate dehydrogenase